MPLIGHEHAGGLIGGGQGFCGYNEFNLYTPWVCAYVWLMLTSSNHIYLQDNHPIHIYLEVMNDQTLPKLPVRTELTNGGRWSALAATVPIYPIQAIPLLGSLPGTLLSAVPVSVVPEAPAPPIFTIREVIYVADDQALLPHPRAVKIAPIDLKASPRKRNVTKKRRHISIISIESDSSDSDIKLIPNGTLGTAHYPPKYNTLLHPPHNRPSLILPTAQSAPKSSQGSLFVHAYHPRLIASSSHQNKLVPNMMDYVHSSNTEYHYP